MKERIIKLLDREEPDYAEVSKIGLDAVPFLLEITKEGNPRLAPRAVYASSLIQNEQSIDVIREGTRSSIPDVRVAAAAGLRNLKEHDASDFVDRLLQDEEVQVRKVTLNSILSGVDMADSIQSMLKTDNLQSIVKSMVQNESVEYVRNLAQQVHDKLTR